MKGKITLINVGNQEKILTIKVIPKSSKNEIVGWENGILKVRLKAIPEKGEANETLIAFLSKEFEISKSEITLLRGHKSRIKQIKVKGKSPQLEKLLSLTPVSD